jgi:hypothetical protein
MSKPTPCPGCGAEGSGAFCTHCGASRTSGHCPSCGAVLAGGARFCTGCGAATGAAAPAAGRATPTGITPAGLATGAMATAVIAVIVVMASGGFGGQRPTPAAVSGGSPTLGAPAPDISSMTPREQFGRLADRIQASLEAGDTDKVAELFPMLEGSYELLLPGDRDIDARFHMGLLLGQTGQFARALVQIDSIRLESPVDLFASYLAATVASAQGDEPTAKAARGAFAKAYAAEMGRGREDYAAHQVLLSQFLETARAD